MRLSLYARTLALLLLVLGWGCGEESYSDREQLLAGFVSPPDSIKTSVYWYWVNDHISKEGVVADLHAMKEAGIGRAFIGNIGLEPGAMPYGNVKMLSPEWWDILRTALKTATELNIEIGIFNSPGWSQSGGPWVKPEESMRYLTSSETRVSGPGPVEVELPLPATPFQDVKVLAFPLSNGARNPLTGASAQTAAPFGISASGNLTIDWQSDTMHTVRSLTLLPSQGAFVARATFQAFQNGAFRTIKQFRADRSNTNLNVGFLPNGPVVAAIPETTAQQFRLLLEGATPNAVVTDVKLSEQLLVESYVEKSLGKMFQSPLPYWNEYQWPAQPDNTLRTEAIAPERVLDISASLRPDGKLVWKAPEGDWMILRMGMTPTGVVNSPASPEGTGLEIDKLSKKHVESHFNAFLGEIIRRIPAEERACWKVIVEDSYETGGQNYTDDFLEKFKTCYGYDPTPWLPVFSGKVVLNRDASDRFLWDVRRLVADLVAYEYVGGLREVGEKEGLGTWLENYGHWGFPGEFLQYGGQSTEIGGEFWSEGELGSIECRAAASCAHIYGKNAVSAESFTCSGAPWSRYPYLMKKKGDWSFTEGINNTLLHVYIQQPDNRIPGINAWFGNEFNRNNTWFSHLDLFITYIRRSNYMLRQGLHVADVAYFIGEDAPKMTGIRDPEIAPGYTYDYINAEVILNRLNADAEGFYLPDGTRYKLLVLPPLATMRPEILHKIKSLIEAGGAVMGLPPTSSPSLQNYPSADSVLQETAHAMWENLDGVKTKERKLGRGILMQGYSIAEAMERLAVKPDFVASDKAPIAWLHRKTESSDIYFVSNQSEEPVQTTLSFRVAGRMPELCDAVTAEVRPLPAYRTEENITSIPIRLAPLQSAFVLFAAPAVEPASGNPADNNPEPFETVNLSENWIVHFDTLWFGPRTPRHFSTLTDWSRHNDDSIRYYSGKARYTKSIVLDSIASGCKISLNLGKVAAMAKVWVNREYAGGAWTYPYSVNVGPFLKPGENRIDVEVAGTWLNRLVGDAALPEARRTTHTFIRPNAGTPLQESGLLGPVTLQYTRQ